MHCSRKSCIGAPGHAETDCHRPEGSSVPSTPTGSTPQLSIASNKISTDQAKLDNTAISRSSTIASPNVHEESTAATSRVRRTNSLGGGRVKQLVAQYEARSQRSEESAEESVRRTRELSRPASGLGDRISDKLAESAISDSLAKLKLETIIEEEEPVSPSTTVPKHRESSSSESISDNQEEDVAEDWYKVNKTSDLD
ncbi:hypothetical protein CTRI78_v001552 [Colletotrichum trifolii]|uniref:Uncharacterized protein n=1 Tax=Colletotrichum trifolii TaxID=5466 RepID=A0A4R8RZ07_COLTR|nr:hypothetical protein CTRI78_v001552 [Colletotrichum trifolii]